MSYTREVGRCKFCHLTGIAFNSNIVGTNVLTAILVFLSSVYELKDPWHMLAENASLK